MKKLLTVFLSLAAVICCVIGISACGNAIDIVGKTFVYESATATFDDTVSQEIKDQYTTENIDKEFEDLMVTFNADGTVSGNFFGDKTTYTTKDGKTSVIFNGEAVATVTPGQNGITLVATSDGITLTLKLKLAPAEEIPDTPDQPSDEDEIAGTYEFSYFTMSSTDPTVGTITRTVGQTDIGTDVVLTVDYVKLCINSDGTVTLLSMFGLDLAEEEMYVFFENDAGCVIKFTENPDGSGGQMLFSTEFENDKLTMTNVMEESGAQVTRTLVLNKVDG